MAVSLCTMYELAASAPYCSCVKKEALLALKVIEDGMKRKCTAQFQPQCFSAVVSHLWTLQHFHGGHFKWRFLVFDSVGSCLVIRTHKQIYQLRLQAECQNSLRSSFPSFSLLSLTFSSPFLMRWCTWAVGILRSSCAPCHVLLAF